MPRLLSLVALLWLAACPALAAGRASAPPPARAVPMSLYGGRWYELARTPNSMQKDCQGATSDFEDFASGAFTVVDTCHAGAPNGLAKVFRVKAKLIAGSDNARFRMAFFGGLIHAEYWILDYARDGAWAIMGTSGGNYVWLLARRPSLPPAQMAQAMARVRELGYERVILTAQ